MRDNDRVRVRHMIDAADAIAGFMAGRQRRDLDDDLMLLFAVVRAVAVIGEAAAQLSQESRDEASEIDWRPIISMHNRLVHGYFDIDKEIVWITATQEIPELAVQLRNLLT
jgi:uncharacterized protein with HEPN domain